MGTTSIDFDLDNGSVSYVDCTNIVEEGEDISFVIAPNPSEEYISIIISEMPEERHAIAIHNSYGQLVLHHQKSDTIQQELIDVTEWPEGIYYLTIMSKNKKRTEKFIVIH